MKQLLYIAAAFVLLGAFVVHLFAHDFSTLDMLAALLLGCGLGALGDAL